MSTSLMPLYAIEEELALLMESVETCPPELEAELQDRIAEFVGREAAKVDGIAQVLSALDWEQRCAGDEIARLTERKRAAAKAQERLEQYVCRVIGASGKPKLIGKTNTLSVRPSDAVVVMDPASLPPQFITVKVTTTESIDKLAIKAALKDGEDVPGAFLEHRSNLVRK